ncbi:MAG: DNA gyrase inhibitor YacG [Alphaproteobacteria bacterium]|nr:DNA gyrase inhibitor YacG [Alphaproteobacteria bacterium]
MLCPICHKQSMKNFKPFCSKTCANIDLMRWLTEGYRIEGIEKASSDEILEEDLKNH